MAGVKFNQSQIKAGVTKCRAQAIKVHVSEAISEGDILCIVGTESGFISVGIADANVATRRDGPMFVADYAFGCFYTRCGTLEGIYHVTYGWCYQQPSFLD